MSTDSNLALTANGNRTPVRNDSPSWTDLPETALRLRSRSNSPVEQDDNIIIRTETEFEIPRDAHSTSLQYSEVLSREQLSTMFRIATLTQNIEVPSRPGAITFLGFAHNIRLTTFSKLQNQLERSLSPLILLNTTAKAYMHWSIYIESFKHEPEPDLWRDPSQNLQPEDYLDLTLQEPVANEPHSFPTAHAEPDWTEPLPESTDPQELINTYPGTVRFHHDFVNHTPFYTHVPTHWNFERYRPLGWINPSSDVSSLSKTSTRVHFRFFESSLNEIHNNCAIPVVYTDLLLNLLNQMCIEFEHLVRQYDRIDDVSKVDVSDFRKAYIMLLVYTYSSQPPFKLEGISDREPALHLSLFFEALIKHDRIIDKIVFRLPYLRVKETLSVDRYAAVIEAVYIMRDQLRDAQLISTRPIPSRQAI